MGFGLIVTGIAFAITAVAAVIGHLIDKGGDSPSERAEAKHQ